jgi:hypothetical protein
MILSDAGAFAVRPREVATPRPERRPRLGLVRAHPPGRHSSNDLSELFPVLVAQRLVSKDVGDDPQSLVPGTKAANHVRAIARGYEKAFAIQFPKLKSGNEGIEEIASRYLATGPLHSIDVSGVDIAETSEAICRDPRTLPEGPQNLVERRHLRILA